MITNNIENGTIIVFTQSTEPILIVSSNGLGKWGYSLNYGDCWLNPSNIVAPFFEENPISDGWFLKAKLKLEYLFNHKFMSNLDYIEALAKLKEYELP